MPTSRVATKTAYQGTDKLLLGIVLAVLTFWLFAGSLVNVVPAMHRDLQITTGLIGVAISLTALFSGICIVGDLTAFVIAMVAINVLITQGSTLGWLSWQIIVLALAFVIALPAFIKLETTESNSFVDFTLFRNRAYTGAAEGCKQAIRAGGRSLEHAYLINAVGKSADIVAMPGDPIADISATTKVDVVLHEGVIYRAPKYDRSCCPHIDVLDAVSSPLRAPSPRVSELVSSIDLVVAARVRFVCQHGNLVRRDPGCARVYASTAHQLARTVRQVG